MRGDIAFEKFGEIDFAFVTEATPNPVTNSPQRPSFFQRHSGLVAALLCGILAVGIYVGILIAKPDTTPLPPVGTSEGESDITDETSSVPIESTNEDETSKDEKNLIPQNYANPYFVVETIDNQRYLNFYHEHGDFFTDVVVSVSFDSVDAVFDGFYHGILTDTQLQLIANYFPRTINGYHLFDLDDLFEPVLPEEGAYVEVVVTYQGIKEITYVLSPNKTPVHIQSLTPTHTTAQKTLSSKINTAEASAYISKETFDIGQHSATAYTQTVEEAGTRTVIYWADTPSRQGESTFVEYQYLKDENGQIISLDIMAEIYREDSCFKATQSITNTQEIEDFLQDPYAHLSLFDAQAYIPTIDNTQPVLDSNEPYTVHEVDGITYIKFENPHLPSVYTPSSTENLSPLYFTSADMLYHAIHNNGLTLFQRMLLKCYPQTEHGVAMGDLSKLLVSQIPEPYMPVDYYYIIPNVKIGAFANDNYGNHDEKIYFEVTSQSAWATQLSALQSTQDVQNSPYYKERQGSFCGIPCTFYEYAENTPDLGNEKTAPQVICSFTIGEGDEQKTIVWQGKMMLDWLVNPSLGDNFVELIVDDLSSPFSNTFHIFGQTSGSYYIFTIDSLAFEHTTDNSNVIETLLEFTTTTYIP